MIRKIKFLGVGMGAVCAAFLVAGPAAADPLRVEEAPATISGTQEGAHKWTIDYGVFECKVAKFSGTVSSSVSGVVTVTPSYSECGMGSPLFFYPETVTLNGCDYLISLAPSTENGEVSITCPMGKEITITRRRPFGGPTTCIVHIPPQTIGTVNFKNIGAGATREVTLEFKLTGLKYSQTEGTVEVTPCATLEGTTNGTYTGSAVFTATSEATGAHVGLFLE